MQVSPGGPYLISFRSIVPRHDESSESAGAVCFSCVPYRVWLDPHGAGLHDSRALFGHRGAQAIEAGIAVQEVDYATLRTRLLADQQVLDLPGV